MHSLIELKGIGAKTESLFQKVQVTTVEELLRYYPRSYDVYEEPTPVSKLQPGRVYTVSGQIIKNIGINRIRNLTVITTTIAGEGGQLSLTWFNMPFLKSTLRRGQQLFFRGRIAAHKGVLRMEQPAIFTGAQYAEVIHSMQPVYGLTAGLGNQTVKKAVKQALLDYEDCMEEYLPEELLRKYNLLGFSEALRFIHFPRSMEEYRPARRRMAFDDFFFFLLAVQKMKEQKDRNPNSFPMKGVWETEEVMESLPYSLTQAQLRTWSEIERDMQGHRQMSRLIQGDVGSGKTIVAFLAMILCARNGYQSALMVPTEVLAQQHYQDLQDLVEKQGLSFCKVTLLTGSVKGKIRKECYRQIENGEVNLIIGTHALIQESVQYQDLGLVITDEQHRFGVKQRETLASQGKPPHILVMSATPIPRTLAIILYGDLDISVIDQLPAHRLPIKNCVVDTGYRRKAYEFMADQVQQGHQAYVICPMVEESEGMDGENVIDYARILREQYRDEISVEFLHGKMSPAQKNEIMERFARNEISILVSTTVVEVGVNVPNATVMMVENAERFGLAQLHQLRGRVGRGDAQSYCIFVQGIQGEDTKKRLEILNHSNDGFYIAGEDLKLRGPGDLFGIRQSGLMNFMVGDIYQDTDVLKMASEAAAWILSMDYDLTDDNHKFIRAYLEKYLKSDGKSFCL